MKRLINTILISFCLWLISSIHPVFAQEVAYTQYYLNPAGVNPGFTGMEDYLDLKLAFRQGWNDFGVRNDNLFVSAYGPLGTSRRLSIKRNSLRISSIPAAEQEKSARRLRRRHGVGAMMTGRNVGPYSSSNVSVNYAYHLPISKELTVSLGTKIGYGTQRIDFNGYTVRDELNDLIYQQLKGSSPGSQNSFALDFGSVIYSSRFYVGFSSSNLIMKYAGGNNLLSVSNRRQYVLLGAYNFKLNENLVLSPGLRLSETYGYDLNWAVNSRIRYKQFIYIGAAYDNVSKISLLFGLAANKNFSINYSYDHYISNMGSLNVSVHELIVGIALFNKYESQTRLW